MSLPTQTDIDAACESPRSERWLIAYVVAKPSAVGALFSRGITPDHFLGADTHAVADAAWTLFHHQTLGTDESIKAELQNREHFHRLGEGAVKGAAWWRELTQEGTRHVFDAETEKDLEYHIQQVNIAYLSRKRGQAHTESLRTILDPSLPLLEKSKQHKASVAEVLRIEAEAQSTAMDGDELADHLEATMGQGVMRVSTGFPSLDEAIGGGGAAGRLNYVIGRPSHGKSTWLRHIAFNHARRHALRGEDKVFVYFDLENGREEAAIAFLTICINSTAYSKSSALHIKDVERHWETGNHLTSYKLKRFQEGMDLFRTIGPHLIIDTPEEAGHLHVLGRLQTASAQMEVSGWAFDYAGLVSEGEDTINGNVEVFTRGAHRVAKQYPNAAAYIGAQADRRVDLRQEGELRQGDVQWSAMQEKQAKTMVGIRHQHEHWRANGQTFGEEPPRDIVDPFVLKKKGGTGVSPPFRYFPEYMVLIDQQDQETSWKESASIGEYTTTIP